MLDRPLIFLGTNWVMEVLTETCAENGITVAGIIDHDYWGNRDHIAGIPVIDSEVSFKDPDRVQYYRDNFVFFCAVNWQPVADAVSQRNRDKRKKFIDLIKQHRLNCVNIIDQRAKVSPSAQLGHNIYIGDFTTIDPRVQIADFVSVYGQCHIGHDTVIGENSVIQRRCGLVGELTVESDVFVASNVCILKNHSRIAHGTFVHECIYLRRSTLPNEVVSLDGANLRRVRAYPGPVDQ